ncbi:MAG: HAD family hydrolase [Anaerolineales bacterium]|jgi:HAD superfamily hydrolase (TIGR01549 family)
MHGTNGIQALLFDLDGTLRHNLPSGGEVFTEHVRRLGLPVSNEDCLRALRWEHYYWANSVDLRKDLDAFEGDEQAFWRNYSRRRLVALGLSDSQVEEIAPSVSAFMEESYEPENMVPPELPGVLTTLKDLGLRMGVVSNRDNPYWQLLEELGLCPFFEFSLAAGEVNSWKPDVGIFLAALKHIDSLPAETVYIGDNYFADVVGALRAGLRPVLYDPSGIFDDPGCPTIHSFHQLPGILNSLSTPAKSPLTIKEGR